MTDHLAFERLLRESYAARLDGPLDRLCGLFSDARFRIAGASDGKPIAIAAMGVGEIRPWLAMMISAFRLGIHEIRSMVIEQDHAAVHWSAEVNSRITGSRVATEFVDLIEIQDLRISSYTEFFVPL